MTLARLYNGRICKRTIFSEERLPRKPIHDHFYRQSGQHIIDVPHGKERSMRPTHDTLKRPEETIVFLAYPQDVNYKYARFLCTVQPGVAVDPHRHPKLTETFRLMSSVATSIMIEGEAQFLKPNDPIATTVLPNTTHEWVNDTGGLLTFEITFYPLSGQSLQEINIISAFTSYFALVNEHHKNPRPFHKLTTAMKSAMLEYNFRNFSVSVSLVARAKVFLLAHTGQLLGLKFSLDES
jgi:hypothetical protein